MNDTAWFTSSAFHGDIQVDPWWAVNPIRSALTLAEIPPPAAGREGGRGGQYLSLYIRGDRGCVGVPFPPGTAAYHRPQPITSHVVFIFAKLTALLLLSFASRRAHWRSNLSYQFSLPSFLSQSVSFSLSSLLCHPICQFPSLPFSLSLPRSPSPLFPPSYRCQTSLRSVCPPQGCRAEYRT